MESPRVRLLCRWYYRNQKVGSLAPATATSFFPTKPLGCYGDGGAVMTDDDDLAERLRSIRAHGQGDHKYQNVRIGLNTRLDTIQAAILLEKLAVFESEIGKRIEIAALYEARLHDVVTVPRLAPNTRSVWAQYTIRVPAAIGRDRLSDELRQAGVPTAIHYPIPLPRQIAYASYPIAPGGTPVSDRLAQEVLSLPIHADLTITMQTCVIEAIRACICEIPAEI
jgi:dTDP-4-amino-4,6-dideoxygalactose transaminase